jgi:type III secretion protein J
MKKRENYKSLCVSLLICMSCLFCGCGKADLLSNVSESQANDIISILQQTNLAVTKKPGLEGSWTVAIDDVRNFSQAVEILKSKGYPRADFNNMGKIFQKSGMVSSPLEERARLMYAIAESISETLTKIPGVLTARVHVVLPESDPYAEGSIPSSAAVFISYRAEANLEESIREIKYLVTNSIQGLSYDKVSVAMFPVAFSNDIQKQEQSHLTSVLGIVVDQSSSGKLWVLIGVMTLLTFFALAVAGFFGYKFVKKDGGNAGNAKANAPVAVQAAPAEAPDNSAAEEETVQSDGASVE